ncbi:MAG: hypothetical protein IPH07_17365 [Deltaproteobacteria bacterium]|nr:hypothetical protein [Deltaproteobacteria bacterium]MBP7290093.1 hypothetical protein [Nannocystaceae bacterium]
MRPWLATAFVLLVLGVALPAQAARRVRVRDEAGAPIDVEVEAPGPAGRVRTRLCRGTCPESLSRIVVDDSGGRAVLRSAPTLDRLTDTVLLDLHRLGDRCPRLTIEPGDDYFPPAAGTSTGPCAASVVDVVLQRRQLDVDVLGLGLLPVEASKIVVELAPVGVAVTPVAYDATADRLRLRVALTQQGRTLDSAGFTLRAPAYHGAKIVIDLARARRQHEPLQVESTAAVAVVRWIELIRPPSPRDESDSPTTVYCVRYSGSQPRGFLGMVEEAGEEWKNPSCNERRMTCHPLGDGLLCPLLRDDESNEIVAIDQTNSFVDTPTCTVQGGACAFAAGFDDPVVSRPLQLQLQDTVRAVARSGDPVFVILDKFLPDGAQESRSFTVDGSGSFEGQEFVRADPGATRYDMRVFGGALDPSTRRNALLVANHVRKLELLHGTHDATAVSFRRTSVGLRAWSGVEFVSFSPKRNDPELARNWGVAPVVGGAARFELHFASEALTIFPEVGFEGAMKRTWTVDAPGARAHEDHRWVGRSFVGAGLRTRAVKRVPLSVEVVGAWMPEGAPRGSGSRAGDLSIGMLGVRYGFGLLPRFLDRLRASIGIEGLFGAHTRFVLPERTILARVHLRVVFGLSAALGRLLPSSTRVPTPRRRARASRAAAHCTRR